jgi:hypothetical protein
VDRTGFVELFAASPGEHDEDGTIFGIPSLDELALLHAREVMGKTTFVPTQTVGKSLLTHLTFAESGQAGEDTKVGARQAGAVSDVTPDAGKDIISHQSEGMPDPKFLRG